MFSRLAGALLAASLVVPGVAMAQSNLPPGSQVLPIPESTPTHLACARSLVEASGMGNSFLSLIPELMRQVNTTATRTRPELAADMKTVLEGLQNEFFGYTGEMIDYAARLYTALLTEPECKDALAFFQSPVGKKYTDMQPTVFANVSPALESWNKQLSVRIYARVREEMKKKGHEM
jgi:hypothetical protein